MLKKTLFFSNPLYISLKNNQMVINTRQMPEEKRTIPIEDIGFVILENQQITITIPLLNALADNNVAVIFCNNECMPNSMLQILDGNTTQAERYKLQLNASEPLKKGLWKQIVEAKIRNQAALLDKLGKNSKILKPLYSNVKSGDSDNREGIAAKLYWGELFGNAFIRQREGTSPNNLLNYGYTLLRAGVTRALIGSGLLPAFGLFHKNRYNAFPLSDDIMEAYRPYVDEIVYELYTNGINELTKDAKVKLLSLFFTDVIFEKNKKPLEIGLTTTSASLVKCFSGKQKKIIYPKLE